TGRSLTRPGQRDEHCGEQTETDVQAPQVEIECVEPHQLLTTRCRAFAAAPALESVGGVLVTATPPPAAPQLLTRSHRNSGLGHLCGVPTAPQAVRLWVARTLRGGD